MAPRAISTASISFGLVTVPVRVYAATESRAGISFNLLHAKDGVRLREQLVCPEDGEVVERKDVVKGYEFESGRYVTFSPEELKALDEKTTRGIEVEEFVPLASIDPVYFERTNYLSPDKGSDRAFALLAKALEEMQLAAVGHYAERGKDYLVALRPSDGRLVMHQLLHRDEVRPLEEIPAPDREPKPAEMKLARELIQHLRADVFHPEQYKDQVRERVRELIERKVAGEQITAQPPPAPRGQVVDLMEALKASLERRQKQGRAAAPAEEVTAAAAGPRPAAASAHRRKAAPRSGGGSRAPRAARMSRRAG